MLAIDVPGYGLLELEHLVLDLNGTIAMDGALIAGVAESIRDLSSALSVLVLTADTHGMAEEIAGQIGAAVQVIERGSETQAKLDVVEDLGPDGVVFLGNGSNDALALEASALGIAVCGPEGLSRDAVDAADVMVFGIDAALGLLREPKRLMATLRR